MRPNHATRLRTLGLGLGIGALLNLLGMLGNGILLDDAWAAAMPVRPDGAMTGWLSVAVSLVSDFVFGLAFVWLYGAIVPRFGVGFATAWRAALLIWALGVAVPYLGVVRIGWLPAGIVIATCAVALVSFAPAAWLVQRFYRNSV